jgi:hypothetical protein
MAHRSHTASYGFGERRPPLREAPRGHGAASFQLGSDAPHGPRLGRMRRRDQRYAQSWHTCRELHFDHYRYLRQLVPRHDRGLDRDSVAASFWGFGIRSIHAKTQMRPFQNAPGFSLPGQCGSFRSPSASSCSKSESCCTVTASMSWPHVRGAWPQARPAFFRADTSGTARACRFASSCTPDRDTPPCRRNEGNPLG